MGIWRRPVVAAIRAGINCNDIRWVCETTLHRDMAKVINKWDWVSVSKKIKILWYLDKINEWVWMSDFKAGQFFMDLTSAGVTRDKPVYVNFVNISWFRKMTNCIFGHRGRSKFELEKAQLKAIFVIWFKRTQTNFLY